LLLRREEVPGVDIHVVPEVLLEAVVVVAAVVLASVATAGERRSFNELTPSVTLFAAVLSSMWSNFV
jgi:hypothetical protein